MARSLYEIAEDIRADYADRGKSVHYSAAPYVDAMLYLDKVTDYYGLDSGDMILRYALSNLSSWRGETARRVKAEMREMLGLKPTR